MSATGAICECRFCGEGFTPQGIRNHETYCEQNPHKGVPPSKLEEHGFLDDTEPESETGADGDGADPDQESEGPVDLPPRETLESSKNTTGAPPECANCGSNNVVPAAKAREKYQRENPNSTIPELLLAFNRADQYCNECYALDGETYDRPVTIPELFGRDGGDEQ